MQPAVVVVNFTQFRLETHVAKALRMAWALSGGKPLTAKHLLEGTLLVARTDRSAAFVKLSSLLPLTSLPEVRATDTAPADLAAIPLATPMAESFSVAEGFLREKNTVWGRDLVTLALLAKNDPTLDEIARDAGSNTDAVRRAWFDFLSSGDRHRTLDSWTRWWHGAGVPVAPQERATAPTGTAYLFTWNPARYPFPELDEHAQKVKDGAPTVMRWSTGNRREISRGARIFLMRQSEEPRGLVGVGEVQGDVMEGPHWDASQRKDGRRSWLVDVSWAALSREPFLNLSSLIEATGETHVWSSPSGGVELASAVTQRLEETWPRAWARHAHGLRDDRLPDLEPRHWIARFNADTAVKHDSLKLDRYVHAFARVMASRNLTPPLSIGLFGDWGSGKTFFMDRLYEKIEELANEADAEPPLYWHRICQMRFNAWHYTETNLWASLVSTIFNELRIFLDGRESDADQFNRLLNQLELARELRKEAEDKLREAERLRAEAREKVARAERELAELPEPPQPSDEELRRILKHEVDAVVRTDRNSIVKLLEDAAEWSGRQDFKEAAKRLQEGESTVEAAQQLLAEAGTLASRAGFWWRVLSGARLYKTAGFWIVIGVMAAIPAAFAVLESLGMQEGWAQAWTLLGEILTIAGAIIGWLRSRLAGASAVFDRLGSLQANIERSIETARNKDRTAFEGKRDEARAKEKDARDRLERARVEAERATQAEREAHEMVRDSTSQARLGRFIRERTSSADYEKHLGLIAMIHRDFQRLSALMEAARNQEADPALPRIDRIILYIDDLDRCHPPEKVVRVLEAVHLLLFFPLFVVVVGVDSRWVSRSLYKHYEGMLADEAIAGSQEPGELSRAPAESQDFLEKIFQVPFWLRRMEPVAIQRLIHSLIPAEEIERDMTAVPPPPPADEDIAAVTEAGAAVPGGGVTPSGTPAEAPARAAAKRITAEAEMEDDVADDFLTAPSESLKITEAELRFMNQVAPLMPRTPRSVKRFVNIYRLYKAALFPTAFARFVGTPEAPGNFRAVQVLLALVTGAPQFAQRVFLTMRGSSDVATQRLSQVVGTLGGGDEAWQTTLEALREFAQGKNDLELDDLREVSTLVSRYSLHHMVSSAPGEAVFS